jgi:hypothetical protein
VMMWYTVFIHVPGSFHHSIECPSLSIVSSHQPEEPNHWRELCNKACIYIDSPT